jgi:glycerol uptake facilitator-like aquaporin
MHADGVPILGEAAIRSRDHVFPPDHVPRGKVKFSTLFIRRAAKKRKFQQHELSRSEACFALPILQTSTHARGTFGEWVGEFVATFGLLSLILSTSWHTPAAVPYGVAAYITGAYWFTSSTSFANPAVTFARSLTNTFAGIQPGHVLAFIIAQLAGAAAAMVLFWWLPTPANGTRSSSDRDAAK